MKQHLIICTRYPQAGLSKTRLIPNIGAEKAALLQKKMTEKLAAEADRLFQKSSVSSSLFYSGANKYLMRQWLGHRHFVAQQGDDLGSRMEHAFTHTYRAGFDEVLLVGSDIPSLDADLLQQAFTELKSHDIVLGPTQDGGYYLIGMKNAVFQNLVKDLFNDIPWSTEAVYNITVKRILNAGYSFFCLPPLRDIDNYSDLLYAQEKGHI